MFCSDYWTILYQTNVLLKNILQYCTIMVSFLLIGGTKNQAHTLPFPKSIQQIHPHTNLKFNFQNPYFQPKSPIPPFSTPYRTPYRQNPYSTTISPISHPNFQNFIMTKTIQSIQLSSLFISIFTDNHFHEKISNNITKHSPNHFQHQIPRLKHTSTNQISILISYPTNLTPKYTKIKIYPQKLIFTLVTPPQQGYSLHQKISNLSKHPYIQK